MAASVVMSPVKPVSGAPGHKGANNADAHILLHGDYRAHSCRYPGCATTVLGADEWCSIHSQWIQARTDFLSGVTVGHDEDNVIFVRPQAPRDRLNTHHIAGQNSHNGMANTQPSRSAELGQGTGSLQQSQLPAKPKPGKVLPTKGTARKSVRSPPKTKNPSSGRTNNPSAARRAYPSSYGRDFDAAPHSQSPRKKPKTSKGQGVILGEPQKKSVLSNAGSYSSTCDSRSFEPFHSDPNPFLLRPIVRPNITETSELPNGNEDRNLPSITIDWNRATQTNNNSAESQCAGSDTQTKSQANNKDCSGEGESSDGMRDLSNPSLPQTLPTSQSPASKSRETQPTAISSRIQSRDAQRTSISSLLSPLTDKYELARNYLQQTRPENMPPPRPAAPTREPPQEPDNLTLQLHLFAQSHRVDAREPSFSSSVPVSGNLNTNQHEWPQRPVINAQNPAAHSATARNSMPGSGVPTQLQSSWLQARRERLGTVASSQVARPSVSRPLGDQVRSSRPYQPQSHQPSKSNFIDLTGDDDEDEAPITTRMSSSFRTTATQTVQDSPEYEFPPLQQIFKAASKPVSMTIDPTANTSSAAFQSPGPRFSEAPRNFSPVVDNSATESIRITEKSPRKENDQAPSVPPSASRYQDPNVSTCNPSPTSQSTGIASTGSLARATNSLGLLNNGHGDGWRHLAKVRQRPAGFSSTLSAELDKDGLSYDQVPETPTGSQLRMSHGQPLSTVDPTLDITVRQRRKAKRQNTFYKHGEKALDGYIYGPANSENRPFGVTYSLSISLPEPVLTFPEHYDPRPYWRRDAPKEDVAVTGAVVRGNRKCADRFKKAAEGLQKRLDDKKERTIELPERVQDNPDWLAATVWLDQIAADYHVREKSGNPNTRDKKGKGKMKE